MSALGEHGGCTSSASRGVAVPMSTTCSDVILRSLVEWGVRNVYGYPGDGIDGLLGAFNRTSSDARALRFVQARHEETAALMASGHAKLTGDLGVCVAPSGPGAVHLLNGLYDAKLDHAPVLAIVGETDQDAIDLPTLFEDVARGHVHVLASPTEVRLLVDRAIRGALAERTVTCLILRKHVQELDAGASTDSVRGIAGVMRPLVVPSPEALDAAASLLRAGERPAILIGAGARGAEAEVLAMADVLGAGIAKTLLARDILPDDLPFVTGAIGALGTKPSWELMQHCDTLLIVGASFHYSTELELVGDAKATLAALLLLLVKNAKTERWRNEIDGWTHEWWHLLEQRALVDAEPVNPEGVIWALSSRLPDKCIVTADCGTVTGWWARDLKLRPGMRAAVSGGLGTMGCAVPYAIAAKLAYPDRPVVACVGDGAMQMNGLAELLTARRCASQWKDPRFIVLVLDNSELASVTWQMRLMRGEPKSSAVEDLPRFDYAAFAELAGFRGIRVQHPSQINDAWDDALSSDHPVLIDAITDPNVVPLPPHVDLKQLEAFGTSLLRSEPEERTGVLKETLRTVFAMR
ncbi:MAG: thiamine pyrophosphate-binding protein [Labilithrix sp.]|nr:thiamine pyrophosphate-binding protein [Labilithrix sp.]